METGRGGFGWRALVCALVCAPGAARAQDARELQRVIGHAVGTLTTLSAGPGLDAARYRFGADRVDLTKLDFVAPLPLGLGRPPLPDPWAPDPAAGPPPSWVVLPPPVDDDEGWLLQPVLAARAGYALTEDRVDSAAGRAALRGGYIELETVTAGVGVGVRVQLARWLRLEPRADLLVGRTTARAAGHEPGQTLLRALDGVLVGWRAETLTYLVEAPLTLRLPLGPVTLLPRGTAAWLLTDSYSATSSLQRTRSWSTVLQAGADLEVPLFGLALAGCPLVLTAGATVIHYEGDTGSALEYEELFAFPASLVCDVTGRLPLLSRLGVAGEWLTGHDVEGWTVTVAFELGL